MTKKTKEDTPPKSTSKSKHATKPVHDIVAPKRKKAVPPAIVTSTTKQRYRRLAVGRLAALLIIVAAALAYQLYTMHPQAVKPPQKHTLHTQKAHRQPKPKVTSQPSQAAQALTPLTQCEHGTIDIFVAHQDDDLLFMNPDLSDAIMAGKCIRTVYLTAGNDGRDQSYWLNREIGVEAAYAAMANTENAWQQQPVTIHNHLVSVASLNGRPNISLVFVRLPDGNTKGQGFSANYYASLEKLSTERIERITTVDEQASYSYENIQALIANVLQTDKPDTIFSLTPSGPTSEGDHSDHRLVGQLVRSVRNIVTPETPINQYVGYPSGERPSNLTPEQTDAKEKIFLEYARNDPVICRAAIDCSGRSTYGRYISRVYRVTR